MIKLALLGTRDCFASQQTADEASAGTKISIHAFRDQGLETVPKRGCDLGQAAIFIKARKSSAKSIGIE